MKFDIFANLNQPDFVTIWKMFGKKMLAFL